MRHIYRCIAIALVLVLVCASSALASNELTPRAYAVPPDSGLLYMIISSDHTKEEDMVFSAKSENGDIKVESAVSMRSEGYTWFFVVDTHAVYSKEPVKKTEKRILSDLLAMIQDSDQGMLVLSADNFRLGNLRSASDLRRAFDVFELQSPSKDLPDTDSSQLPNTLRRVLEYIDQNKENCPNAAVVVVTTGNLDPSLIDGNGYGSFKTILREYQHITTHVICMVPSSSSRDSVGDWYKRAVRLVETADHSTICGLAVMANDLTDVAADYAVGEVKKREFSLINLVLNPLALKNIGKKLTITQTLQNGDKLEGTADIGEQGSEYQKWEEYWNKHIDTDLQPNGYTPFTKSSTFVLTNYDNKNAIKPEPEIPWALIIGIALGVLILALTIVLIAVRRGHKQKDAPAVSMNYTPVQPRGTVVVLQDAAGTRLTGTMKNGKLTIGRYAGKGSMLVIPNDVKLSGLHATLTKNGNSITIMDNHSTNGTKVNGTVISSAVTLRQNDMVTMGSNTYKVTWQP